MCFIIFNTAHILTNVHASVFVLHDIGLCPEIQVHELNGT